MTSFPRRREPKALKQAARWPLLFWTPWIPASAAMTNQTSNAFTLFT
jgi:hypothetical protein